jgi:hypothetical protein
MKSAFVQHLYPVWTRRVEIQVRIIISMLTRLQVGELHLNIAWKKAEQRVTKLGELILQPSLTRIAMLPEANLKKTSEQMLTIRDYWMSVEHLLNNVWIGGSLNNKQQAAGCMIFELTNILDKLDLWKKECPKA